MKSRSLPFYLGRFRLAARQPLANKMVPNARRLVQKGWIGPRITLRVLRTSAPPKEPTVPAASLRPAVGTISFKLLAAWAWGDACAKFAGISRVLKGHVVLAPYPVMNFAIRLRE